MTTRKWPVSWNNRKTWAFLLIPYNVGAASSSPRPRQTTTAWLFYFLVHNKLVTSIFTQHLNRVSRSLSLSSRASPTGHKNGWTCRSDNSTKNDGKNNKFYLKCVIKCKWNNRERESGAAADCSVLVARNSKCVCSVHLWRENKWILYKYISLNVRACTAYGSIVNLGAGKIMKSLKCK